MGPVGLEPTSNGLKVGRTMLRFVSSGRVLRGGSGVFRLLRSPPVPSGAVLIPGLRLQTGLHSAALVVGVGYVSTQVLAETERITGRKHHFVLVFRMWRFSSAKWCSAINRRASERSRPS